MWKVVDDQEQAEDEFEGYAYSACLVDAAGEVRGLFIDEDLANKIAKLLNEHKDG